MPRHESSDPKLIPVTRDQMFLDEVVFQGEETVDLLRKILARLDAPTATKGKS